MTAKSQKTMLIPANREAKKFPISFRHKNTPILMTIAQNALLISQKMVEAVTAKIW